MAQNDAFLGQQMASDCRLIAVASQRDSSSMKVIAVVTMCFLPGTFVASIFSIPLFDWSANNNKAIYRHEFWQPRFIVYLSVTVPLMALTFAIWAFWIFLQSVSEQKHASAIRTRFALEAEQNEAQVLAFRRSMLQQKDS